MLVLNLSNLRVGLRCYVVKEAYGFLVIYRWGFLEYFVMGIEVYQNELGEFENFCFVEDV